jgi:hypothetical protein
MYFLKLSIFSLRVEYVSHVHCHRNMRMLFCLGEEVQLWHDKESDIKWPGADDVFLELPNIISGVC